LATTDLVNARALLLRSRKTLELIHTSSEDRPLAVQIYGAQPDEMTAAAQWLEEYGASVIDINMGCPVPKVTRGGGGSALLCQVSSTVRLVRSVVESVRIPVTVKMRLGWDDASISAPTFAREFEQAGVAAVTIHGRTRAQGFRDRVNLDGIRAVVDAVHSMPVLGNGDVRSLADAHHMLAVTGCAGVAIGRGALVHPSIFRDLAAVDRGLPLPPPLSYRERLDLMRRHLYLLARQLDERRACLTFRKIAGWYGKVLRPGRQLQQELVRLESLAQFDDILDRLREREASWTGFDWTTSESPIPVPAGPISHW
jgi:nifR3 family TIM-barrel protein